MFPSAMQLTQSSLFDKNFLLNAILHAKGLSYSDAWAEYLMNFDY